MKVFLGSDHAGFHLKESVKEFLKEKKDIEVEDLGTWSQESVNYAEYGAKVAEKVSVEPTNSRGILICGTGIGMAIMANKFPRIRAAVCHDEYTAMMSRLHNDANIISIGSRVLQNQGELVKRMISVWLETEFEGGRHQRRLDFISEMEERYGRKT